MKPLAEDLAAARRERRRPRRRRGQGYPVAITIHEPPPRIVPVAAPCPRCGYGR